MALRITDPTGKATARLLSLLPPREERVGERKDLKFFTPCDRFRPPAKSLLQLSLNYPIVGSR